VKKFLTNQLNCSSTVTPAEPKGNHRISVQFLIHWQCISSHRVTPTIGRNGRLSTVLRSCMMLMLMSR